ncbi:MAG: hypothetical protein WBD81_23460 [Collimonas pratensis]|uniref:hypothetical protein n=1 Tax=Collimonas pratensis TaxID=279113 RepID=UPI003C7709DB
MKTSPQQQLREDYAKELTVRFKQLRRWAIDNWPLPDTPLSKADFNAAESDIRLLLGAKLNTATEARSPEDLEPQYLPVTPAPWP